MTQLRTGHFRAVSLLLIGLMYLFAGCSKPAMVAFPPYLPPQYYDCIEVRPSELVITYFSTYGNMAHSESEYNGKYFVFKNQIVEEWMLKSLEEGYIWVEGNVMCELVSPEDMKAFKIGDRIDIVGRNAGVINYTASGLKFVECIVLAAGTVQLPASGGSAFIGGY